jgi:hypothetical protein
MFKFKIFFSGGVSPGATLGEGINRKISSSSLQIPGGLLRRSNSDGSGTNTHCCHQDDSAAAKKVTFSQVSTADVTAFVFFISNQLLTYANNLLHKDVSLV